MPSSLPLVSARQSATLAGFSPGLLPRRRPSATSSSAPGALLHLPSPAALAPATALPLTLPLPAPPVRRRPNHACHSLRPSLPFPGKHPPTPRASSSSRATSAPTSANASATSPSSSKPPARALTAPSRSQVCCATFPLVGLSQRPLTLPLPLSSPARPVYLTQFRKNFPLVNEEYVKHFTGPQMPARTCVGVASLPGGAWCEVECIAVPGPRKCEPAKL